MDRSLPKKTCIVLDKFFGEYDSFEKFLALMPYSWLEAIYSEVQTISINRKAEEAFKLKPLVSVFKDLENCKTSLATDFPQSETGTIAIDPAIVDKVNICQMVMYFAMMSDARQCIIPHDWSGSRQEKKNYLKAVIAKIDDMTVRMAEYFFYEKLCRDGHYYRTGVPSLQVPATDVFAIANFFESAHKEELFYVFLKSRQLMAESHYESLMSRMAAKSGN